MPSSESQPLLGGVSASSKRPWRYVVVAVLAAFWIIVVFLVVGRSEFATTRPLSSRIHVRNIFHHLRAFQEIADVHGNRATGPGYDASTRYVISQLEEKTDCVISTQHFKVPVWTEMSPVVVARVKPEKVDFQAGVDVSLHRKT
ncbi:hypothetical protein BDK51DRAFT_27472 [Blyttiomyces helicus]|uniref:Uncharacterized protein n=1 Tax=Blyttiomyces helicus TaxID=388810 RepID=A0A4P9WH44_9FUNG|nr:hypothetical protein BDK51DRAFT_27472 [Blyttiomyces helicus]|eukprot:RKO90380.1 hypothetical protein BDK51DRAFT_27472 [Blyttiomyces helicus]